MEGWECACGATFENENEAKAHIGPGHPWLSRLTDEGMEFIHTAGDSWMKNEEKAGGKADLLLRARLHQ